MIYLQHIFINCYNWAQNITVPYSPQQVDFKTAFAVHLFDVCKTEGGENKQLDFVIRENEFPKGVAKGATNTTLNIIYQAIKIFVKDRKKKFKYYTYVAIVSHRIKIIFTFFFGFIYVCPVGTIALPLILWYATTWSYKIYL